MWRIHRRERADPPGQMALDSIRERIGVDKIGPIARRYFVSNGFDGALTGVGITVGAYLSGIEDAMLTDLSETQVERDKTSTQVVNALMSGLGPLADSYYRLFRFSSKGHHSPCSRLPSFQSP